MKKTYKHICIYIDHGTIDAEMIKLSDGLKPKVKKLHVMEGNSNMYINTSMFFTH